MSSTKPASARTPEEIEAEIVATRARLAESIDELVDKASPRNVAKRQVEHARSQVIDPEGNLRTEKIVTVAGAIAAVVAVLLIIRRLVNRR